MPVAESILTGWRPQLRQQFAHALAEGRLRREWLVWLALLHDIGKPATRTVALDRHGEAKVRFLQHERVGAELAGQWLEHLRFSRHEITLTEAVIASHMRPHQLDEAFTGQPISRPTRSNDSRSNNHKMLR